MKSCSVCKGSFPFSDFNKNTNAKDGYNYRCRSCDNAYLKKRRSNPAVALKERQRSNTYRKARLDNFDYRLKTLFQAAKARALQKGRQFELDIDFLKAIYPLDGKCPVFGIKLEFGNAGFRDNSPSIDRIDSNGGYTKDNVQIISWKANRLKAHATVEELELLLAFMKQGD